MLERPAARCAIRTAAAPGAVCVTMGCAAASRRSARSRSPRPGRWAARGSRAGRSRCSRGRPVSAEGHLPAQALARSCRPLRQRRVGRDHLVIQADGRIEPFQPRLDATARSRRRLRAPAATPCSESFTMLASAPRGRKVSVPSVVARRRILGDLDAEPERLHLALAARRRCFCIGRPSQSVPPKLKAWKSPRGSVAAAADCEARRCPPPGRRWPSGGA